MEKRKKDRDWSEIPRRGCAGRREEQARQADKQAMGVGERPKARRGNLRSERARFKLKKRAAAIDNSSIDQKAQEHGQIPANLGSGGFEFPGLVSGSPRVILKRSLRFRFSSC